VIQKLVHDLPRQVHRNGKSDSLIASGAVRQNRRVDSHQLAAIIDQARRRNFPIDRRIRLDEILVVLDSEVAASLWRLRCPS